MLKTNPSKFTKSETGQTLIETLVACFVLVMGISAALGLANYSLSATNGIKQQLVGMGLAREGLEVIKNMRDTNWLKVPFDSNCYNFSDAGAYNGICYRNWLNTPGGYNISPGTYYLTFQDNGEMPWSAVASEKNQFGLNTATDTGVLYNGGGTSATEGNSGFARKITITEDTSFSPFDKDTGGRVKVSSQVWWAGKGCTMTDEPNPSKSCSVTLETYLTNWRVF